MGKTSQVRAPTHCSRQRDTNHVAQTWYSQGVGRIKKYRESRINRTGNKPQRESKPKLVKLTDAANLAPEGPKVLKAAAEIKMAEDLAPQKLKR